jgi:alpha-beta hydrolase superfamily lysophospholipase
MSIIKKFIAFLLCAATGSIATLIGVYIWSLQARPELKPWHRATLDAEFRAEDAAAVRSLDDYLRTEEKVFEQLRRQVYDNVGAEDRRALNRYNAGSLADPTALPLDGNRTRELAPAAPVGGIVLVHGLSDSPYTMHNLGERMAAAGLHVVMLRLPGHGTAPSGLLRVRWQDWAAAVRIAARHVRARIGPDKPLYLGGFSTGAALSVEYCLARLQGEDLPIVDRLVLLSPAIGVTQAAALAVWQARLSSLPGLEKVAWDSIGPEFDPYKYVSFAVNAADQIYRLTAVINARMRALSKDGTGVRLPPILAFQSIADSTVTAETLVKVLFSRLSPSGHRLVVFDINRHADAEPLFKPGIRLPVERLFEVHELPFDFVLVTNADARSDTLVAKRHPAGRSHVLTEPTRLTWPRGIYSLSHVALPFPPDDPLYGAIRPSGQHILYLGRPELLGEWGILAVPATDLIRLRYNPFFSYMDQTINKFLGLRRIANKLDRLTIQR